MKFRVAISTFILAVTALVAAPSQAAPQLTVGVVYDIGGRGDLSFNDAAAAGLALAQKKFPFTVDAVVTDGTSEDREKRVRSLAENGCNPIVVVGPGFSPALQVLAIEYPDIQFAILNDASVPALNVTSLIFKEKQGAYLAGFAAAIASKTKKVAMIATANQADIYHDGFKAGVISAKRSVKSSVKYVSGSAVVATKQLMDAGNDVIFVTRPGSDNDIFTTIVARNRSASKNIGMISVSPDQYVTVTKTTKKYLLATVLKRIDRAMYDVIAHAYADNEIPDVLDEIAGIFGHTYGVGKGIEFRTYSSVLTSQSAAINKAALSAQKIHD